MIRPGAVGRVVLQQVAVHAYGAIETIMEDRRERWTWRCLDEVKSIDGGQVADTEARNPYESSEGMVLKHLSKYLDKHREPKNLHSSV